MNLSNKTHELRAGGHKALVAFLTAGYPDTDTFMRLVRAAARAGCDVIEVGIPFSDPIADGPLIQESSKAALDAGMSLSRALELCDRLRKDVDAPLVLMSYYNPVLRMGLDGFAIEAAAAGVAGVILPDVSFEESAPARTALRARDLSYVDLIAPTSSDARIDRIAANADGFVYLVSVTGVTGVRSARAAELAGFVGRVRSHTDTPLYVGFGISSPERASETAALCDGVIIGSALINEIKSATRSDEAVSRVEQFLAAVRAAIDA